MFAHLHVHTQYSLLDGMCRIPALIQRAKDLGQTSIAITDHGVMYGVVDFYKQAKAAGIHPVIGCEVYVAPRKRIDRIHEMDASAFHLVLLAETEEGYRNLMKLSSLGFLEGYYYKPRVDMELLEQYHEGIIALSACLSGQIPSCLLDNRYEEAKRIATAYRDIFGKDHFYLELQDHGLVEQQKVNAGLKRLAKELDIGLVATNDVHYIQREDASAQDILMCVQTGKKRSDADRMRFDCDRFYLTSEEEMVSLFPDCPEAIANTERIAQRCQVTVHDGEMHLPHFSDLPEGMDADSYLRHLAEEGLKKRYCEMTAPLRERLDYELKIIREMGFSDYFLIVWDFVRFAREQKIMVGPGRGSGAGCLVSYCLQITNIDPIRYQLLFERFLNPERITMPDIDIDFCYERRQEVIDYVTRKYGQNCVAQIITFGTLAAKAVIRDVGRVLDMPYARVDQLADRIPFGINMTIERALRENSELSDMIDSNADYTELMEYAKALEGLPRHASTHASAVLITQDDIVTYVPLQKNQDAVTTQFPMKNIEELGLLKADFLGLRTLTVLRDTILAVEKRTGKRIDIEQIDFDDPNVYAMIAAGETEGVFQLESTGMKRFMTELKPTCLEDVIAGISLYRPGPMQQIPTYIKNKGNPEQVTYSHPLLEPILSVTYGCIVYQEQVMQIVRRLGGYSYGRADLVRRAMAKKKADVMERERSHFIYGIVDERGTVEVPGALRNGVSESVANALFDEISRFAEYAFNKSHAAAYAHLAYQTAYLKHYFPKEYMAALLTSFLGTPSKISRYVAECNRLGIRIIAPHVNRSAETFSVCDEGISFALCAIKNVGRSFSAAIAREREEKGAFTDLYDFCSRMNRNDCNKRMLESLIKSGALDGVGGHRAQLYNAFERVLETVHSSGRRAVEGQMSFFGFGESEVAERETLPDCPAYPKERLLMMEKEATELYFSGHPLDEFADRLAVSGATPSSEISDLVEGDTGSAIKNGSVIKVAGVVSSVKEKKTKRDEIMAFVTLEDLFGSVEVLMFPKVWAECRYRMRTDEPIVIQGRVSLRDDEPPSLIGESVSELPQELPKKLYLRITPSQGHMIDKIQQVLSEAPGELPVYLYYEAEKNTKMAPKSLWVTPTQQLLQKLSELLGKDSVRLV